MTNPQPRPALQRAPDSGTSPATAVTHTADVPAVDALSAVPTWAVPKGKQGKKPKSGADAKATTARKAPKNDGKQVEITFLLPKAQRKALDKRADEQGYSRDDVLAMLVRAWLEG